MKKLAICCILYVALLSSIYSQFVNLNFEQSLFTIGTVGGGVDSIAWPGWLSPGGGASHNTGSNLCESIFDTDLNAFYLFQDRTPLEGDFTAFIHASMLTAPGDASIGQSGIILNSDIETLIFAADYTGDFRVFFRNRDTSTNRFYTSAEFIDLGPNPYNLSFGHLYGLDISDITGGTMNFGFYVYGDTTPTENWAFIDAVQFSTDPIPEPETYALFLGSAALLFACWRKRSQQCP